MSYKYVVGIDGGGTRCRALLQDIDGNTLGEGAAGPAIIMTNPEQAMGSVIDATLDAIESAALPITCEEGVASWIGRRIFLKQSSLFGVRQPICRYRGNK